MARVLVRVDPALDGTAPPLTQARISIRLRDGRTVGRAANGARGYPEQPLSDEELDAKFLACARRTIPEAFAARALALLRRFEELEDVRPLMELLQP
jgi:2-methylcitrate dehydratase PrpD